MSVNIVKNTRWFIVLVIILSFLGCATVTPPSVSRIPSPPPEVEKKPEVVKVPEGPKVSVHTVKRGDTVYRIAKAYGVSPKAIITTNHISDVRSLEPGQKLIIPGGKKETGTYVSPASVGKPALGGKPESGFIWPLKGKVVSYYGEIKNGLRNTGIDIIAGSGQDVIAVKGGVVITATDAAEGSGDRIVVIEHQRGLDSWYGYVGEILVNKGSKVKQGQIIARVGNQPILHFKVFVNDRPVDPLKYLR